MVEIPLTPEQFARKGTELEQQEGIKLSGNEGTISKSGVKARYAYAEGKLSVTILEKPFIVSTAYCEEQVRKWLGSPA
jgi:hypothetical protein